MVNAVPQRFRKALVIIVPPELPGQMRRSMIVLTVPLRNLDGVKIY